MGTPVLQEWVTKLSWKEQTGLISAIRGEDNDGAGTTDTKALTKLVRKIVLNNADPKTEFMVQLLMPPGDYAILLVAAVSHAPSNWTEHMLLALRIIAKKNKDVFVTWFINEILETYDKTMAERVTTTESRTVGRT